MAFLFNLDIQTKGELKIFTKIAQEIGHPYNIREDIKCIINIR